MRWRRCARRTAARFGTLASPVLPVILLLHRVSLATGAQSRSSGIIGRRAHTCRSGRSAAAKVDP